MIKLLLTFALFAGIVYYYDINLIALVERSGAPEWLAERGYATKSDTAAVGNATTTVGISSSTPK